MPLMFFLMGVGHIARRPRFARECSLDRQVVGKNRERVRFCVITVPDTAKTNLGRAAFHCLKPVTPCAVTGFKQDMAFKRDYYALKSHYADLSCRTRNLGIFKIITR